MSNRAKMWLPPPQDEYSGPRNTRQRATKLVGFGRFRGNYRLKPILIGFPLAVVGVSFLTIAVLMYSSEPQANAYQKRVVVVEREAPVDMVDVLVPLRELEPGKPVDPSMFKVVKRPSLGLSDRSVRSFEQIRGLYARAVVPAGEPFVSDAMTSVRPSNKVAASIPIGFRAVTINVNATTGVEGWANPGASVDVHWITSFRGEKTATILVENAKVLSAERQVEAESAVSGPVPATVTLLTSERDAQKISLASTEGQLVLHLRGASDPGKGAASTGTLTVRDLISSGKPMDEKIQGTAKMRTKDGTTLEWSIVDNKVVPRAIDAEAE